MEGFFDIPNYEGEYQIDIYGNVYSVKSAKFLKPRLNSIRYNVVNLWSTEARSRKTFRVHQLMAFTFLDKDYRSKKLVVDHIDNDPLNNALSNLQLITNRENTSKDKTGSSQYTGVMKSPTKGKWRACLRINQKKHWLGTFSSEIEAHNAYQDKLKEINATNNPQHYEITSKNA